MFYCPQNYKLIAGKGVGMTMLNAFDNALQNSGVENYNLVKISSILPPCCNYSEKILLPFGSLLPTAYSTLCTSESGKQITAAIGVGIPDDPKQAGVIMEYSGFTGEEDAKCIVKQMVVDAMNNRGSIIKQVVVSAASCICLEKFECVFAAVVLW